MKSPLTYPRFKGETLLESLLRVQRDSAVVVEEAVLLGVGGLGRSWQCGRLPLHHGAVFFAGVRQDLAHAAGI